MGVRLPAEYQEVEYLDSTSTLSPYINTGIPITEDLTFEIGFQLSDITSRMYFMGEYNGADFYLYISAPSPSNLAYFQTSFSTSYNNTTLIADTQRHKFIYQINNGTLIVKDSSTTILTKSIGSFTGRAILVAGTSISQSARIPCKTFESKMTKAGVVIQDLVPCYRKSDDKPGMYDLVTKEFFTNAGTGEFLVGPDVIDSISPWLVARRMGIVSQLARINNPPDGAIFWNGVNCEDVQNGFGYYYTIGGGASSDIRITVENGVLVIYKPTSINFDCDPVDSVNLSGKHTVSVVCKTSRPLIAGNDQLQFGITSGSSRTRRIVEKDITSDVTAEYKTFSVNFQSDTSGWPFIRATGSVGKDPYSVIVKEWVIS